MDNIQLICSPIDAIYCGVCSFLPCFQKHSNFQDQELFTYSVWKKEKDVHVIKASMYFCSWFICLEVDCLRNKQSDILTYFSIKRRRIFKPQHIRYVIITFCQHYSLSFKIKDILKRYLISSISQTWYFSWEAKKGTWAISQDMEKMGKISRTLSKTLKLLFNYFMKFLQTKWTQQNVQISHWTIRRVLGRPWVRLQVQLCAYILNLASWLLDSLQLYQCLLLTYGILVFDCWRFSIVEDSQKK